MRRVSQLAEAFVRSGKVRDLYRLDDGRLLLVASDRSARSTSSCRPRSRQGPGADRSVAVLVRARPAGIVPNHLSTTDPADDPRRRDRGDPDAVDDLRGRMMLCRRAEVVPGRGRRPRLPRGLGLEGVPRDGAVCGIPLPAGLRESDRLPEPIFTPATKAEVGEHDENITFDEMVETLVGGASSPSGSRGTSRSRSTRHGAARAERGRDHARRHQVRVRAACPRGELLLIDEVLTPDSSRFWEPRPIEPGRAAGLLRQAVRPRLARTPGLGQDAPGPALPREVVEAPAPATSRRTSASPAPASIATSRRTSSPDERAYPRTRVNVTPKPGHPRSRRAGRSRAASATSASTGCTASASAAASS